jgi:hypothetical protein
MGGTHTLTHACVFTAGRCWLLLYGQGCDPDAAALALLDPGHTGGVDLRLIGRLMEELTGLTALRRRGGRGVAGGGVSVLECLRCKCQTVLVVCSPMHATRAKAGRQYPALQYDQGVARVLALTCCALPAPTPQLHTAPQPCWVGCTAAGV